ncbi:TonB-dependent receptor plug domain-containing protein [Zeaxanthinibacter enoshimensis]|uniref:TonB-dependent receptor plug domain-containing protein n=1 Tax=Zeaxanthinibacter enoshimensis TaxID=392009 RepID=UPI003564D02F
MKIIQSFLLFSVILLNVLTSCGNSKSTVGSNTGVKETLSGKNRMTVPLIEQIRRLPGVIIRNGVPVFVKATSEISTARSSEPLYILDGYTVGNSFSSLNGLVENVNIKSIEALTGSDASFYGSRGANGVIIITTRQ